MAAVYCMVDEILRQTCVSELGDKTFRIPYYTKLTRPLFQRGAN